jgi:tRNA1Val (adenine37-N6)-methyltransferase
MKVCTDACLFGAWVAQLVQDVENETPHPLKINTILDIGSGTGLLALMLAQKTEAMVDAIEIDVKACTQAKENIERSLWASRIMMICGDINQFTTNRKYDLVVCNPPFYENSLQSPHASANLARHGAGLKLEDLACKASDNLPDWGLFAVLLPYTRAPDFVKTARGSGLQLIRQVNVKQTQSHYYFRVMLVFGRAHSPGVRQLDISIRDEGGYSKEFLELLKDYYLHL